MKNNSEMTLTCLYNGNTRVFPFTNISQARINDLCAMICWWREDSKWQYQLKYGLSWDKWTNWSTEHIAGIYSAFPRYCSLKCLSGFKWWLANHWQAKFIAYATSLKTFSASFSNWILRYWYVVNMILETKEFSSVFHMKLMVSYYSLTC